MSGCVCGGSERAGRSASDAQADSADQRRAAPHHNHNDSSKQQSTQKHHTTRHTATRPERKRQGTVARAAGIRWLSGQSREQSRAEQIRLPRLAFPRCLASTESCSVFRFRSTDRIFEPLLIAGLPRPPLRALSAQVPMSVSSLPPPLHASFAHLLQRLSDVQCPLVPQMDGGAQSVDLFAHGALAFDALQSLDDSGVHASAAGPQLILRLALLQWLISRYDSDLPRAFVDVAVDYADQRANQTLLGQFKRVHRIATFLGLFPVAGVNTLAIIVGGSAPGPQLSLLHTLLDLIASLPAEPFFASTAAYSGVNSYAAHNDVEFHKHIRLMQCVSLSSAGLETGGSESALTEQIELFPATLMMTAHALSKVKEKQGHKKQSALDPSPLLSEMSRWQSLMDTKAQVLSELVAAIPLTAAEDFAPSLDTLEHHLDTLAQNIEQFNREFGDTLRPMVEAVLAQPMRISTLGRTMQQLSSEKQSIDRVLSACSATNRHYSSILHSGIAPAMAALLQSKPDDRTTLKLSETRKVFEQTVARLEKQIAALKEAAEVAAAARAEEDAATLRSSTRPSSAASLSASSLRFGSASFVAAQSNPTSILTSSVDLSAPGAHESEGAGSAGLFSPVKARALPERLVTRTGHEDRNAIEAEQRRAERQRQLKLEREEAVQRSAFLAQSPRQRAIFAEVPLQSSVAEAAPLPTSLSQRPYTAATYAAGAQATPHTLGADRREAVAEQHGLTPQTSFSGHSAADPALSASSSKLSLSSLQHLLAQSQQPHFTPRR